MQRKGRAPTDARASALLSDPPVDRRRGRRSAAIPLVAAAHLALFWWLGATTPEKAEPFGPEAIEVGLYDGREIGEAPAALAAAAAAAVAAADPSEAEATPTEAEAEASEEPPPPAEPQPSLEPAPEPPPPQRPAEPAATESSLVADVMAQARAIIGAPAEGVAEPTQAVGSAAAAAPGGSPKCEAGEGVAAELRNDQKALAALARLPRSALSVADALQLWGNGVWVDPTTLGGKGALEPIQEAVLRGVISLPPECLDTVFPGPRFLTIRTGERDIVVVLGSGEWRWRELLDSAGANVGEATKPD